MLLIFKRYLITHMRKFNKSILFAMLLVFFSPIISIAQSALFIEKDPPQYGKPFNKVPDTRDITIYQVNMRVFSKDGNFKGVLARLDSIKVLGANVVYLMPVYPVGILKTSNSPYCVRDYKAV